MKHAQYFLTLFLLLMMMGKVYAQNESRNSDHKLDIQLNECMENSGYATIPVCECYDKGYNGWLQEMNRIYDKLLLVVDKNTKNLLIDAQTEWMVYQKKETEFSRQMYADMQGSMYDMMAASRKYDIVKKRALELEGYLNDYTFDDNPEQVQTDAYAFNQDKSKQEVEAIVKQIRFFYNNCVKGIKDVIRVNEDNAVVPGSGIYNETMTFTYDPIDSFEQVSKIEKTLNIAARKENSEWLFYNYNADEDEGCACVKGEKKGNLMFYYYNDGRSSLRMYFHLNQVIKVIVDRDDETGKTYYPPFADFDMALSQMRWPDFDPGQDALEFKY